MVQVADRQDLPPSKRQKILSGAREAFMDMGFERASVDEIAARAGVSKATVYNHFHDKAALFVASFSEQAADLKAELMACLSAPPGSMEDALQVIGEKLVSVKVSPTIVALHRQTTAETGRFPEIGRLLFDRGPAVVYEKIAAHLTEWARRGELRVDDARAAAVQLVVLCQSDLQMRAQLGILEYPADREIRETVQSGVRTFLRAYRP